MRISTEDLFFTSLVHRYVEENPRFLRRDWLAKQLDEKLQESGKRFVLLTAEPGAGKSAFMAQLAHDHSDWLRYFIRRDQREVLEGVSDKSLLLRIGYQLAARHPELFSQEQLRVSVTQRIGQVADGGEAVGAVVERLTASPFYRKILEIEQHVRVDQGKVIGLRVEELVIEPRLLQAEDLLHLALIDPAQALARLDPGKQLVILVDALDEIRYHQTAENILAWLTHCRDLPENIRFVLSSRPPDEALRSFCEKQVSRLTQLPIAESDPDVQRDIQQFVTHWVDEPAVTQTIKETGGNPETFATNATAKAHGNLGYVDALARGVDRAIADMGEVDEATRGRGARTLEALLSQKELPDDQSSLYAFFFNQIKNSVARERIEHKDLETGETYDKAVWPAVYAPILGVLAVAMEPVDLELIIKIGGIRAERSWVSGALNRLLQFLDNLNGRYRLYHATVVEFLTADETRNHPDLAIAALYQDAVSRHRQIADRYWRYQDDWSKCDGYGLRNLAAHLDVGQQVERLHQLITDAWMQARVVADGYRYSGFIADVMRAWERARTEAVRQIETNDAELTAFATCFRYALIQTSISSLSRNYPPALVTRALETHVWTIEHALDVCQHLADHEWRARLYVAVLKANSVALSESNRHQIESLALAAVKAVTDRGGRAATLTVVAPHLHENHVAEALLVVQTFRPEEHRVNVLEALAPQLNQSQVDTVIEWMMEFENDKGRVILLAVLASRLTEKQMNDAFALAKAIKNEQSRANALAAVAPRLNKAQLKDALTVTKTVKDRGVQALTFAKLAIHLRDTLKARVLAHTYALVEGTRKKEDCAEAMYALTSQLTGTSKTKVLSDAFSVAMKLVAESVTIPRDFHKIWTLLLPQLSELQIEEAFTCFKSEENNWTCAHGLAVLAPRLSREQVEEALGVVETMWYDEARAVAWEGLAQRMTVSQLKNELTVAKALKDEDAQVRALAAVAPELTGVVKTQLVSNALALANRIRTKRERASAWAALIPYLPEPLKTKVLDDALEVAQTKNVFHLEGLLVQLAPQLRGQHVAVALQLSKTFSDIDRAMVLALLATGVSGTRKTRMLINALALARQRVRWDDEDCAELIAMVAPQLTGVVKTQLVNDALELANSIRHKGARVSAWAALVPYLRESLKAKVLDEAVTVTQTVQDLRTRLHLLLLLLPSTNQLDLLRESRCLLLDQLDENHTNDGLYESRPRAAFLASIISKHKVCPPLFGAETIATIAQHIVEIGDRWRWVQSEKG